MIEALIMNYKPKEKVEKVIRNTSKQLDFFSELLIKNNNFQPKTEEIKIS